MIYSLRIPEHTFFNLLNNAAMFVNNIRCKYFNIMKSDCTFTEKYYISYQLTLRMWRKEIHIFILLSFYYEYLLLFNARDVSQGIFNDKKNC